MNHDVLRNVLYSSVLSVYKILYDEYQNEDIAKRNTFKLAKDVLVDFGMRGDLYKTYEVLMEEYQHCKDESQRLELYRKIEVIQRAMTIVKEVNPVGK